MRRNDLCFCMSGKKKKVCHADIHEESQAAAKLKIYSQLEYELQEHRESSEESSLCVKGCIQCCYDYFTIQDIEFDLILKELANWEEEKLNNLIKRVEKYWKLLEKEQPEATRLLLDGSDNAAIEKTNASIDKTSFPCVFLDENTQLCQIYQVRPFKCRIFGTTYHYPKPGEVAVNTAGAVGIACENYGNILNDDNFDTILWDVTELLDENIDFSIVYDSKGRAAAVKPEFSLLYNLYQHFIVKKLGLSIVDFDEKFKMPRNTYGSKL